MLNIIERNTKLGSWFLARGIEQGIALFKEWLGNLGLPDDPTLSTDEPTPYTVRLYKDLLWLFANLFGVRVYIGSGHKVLSQVSDLEASLQQFEFALDDAEDRLDEIYDKLRQASDDKAKEALVKEAKEVRIIIGRERFEKWLESKDLSETPTSTGSQSGSNQTSLQKTRGQRAADVTRKLSGTHILRTRLNINEKDVKEYLENNSLPTKKDADPNDIVKEGVYPHIIKEFQEQLDAQKGKLEEKLKGTLVFSTLPIDFLNPGNWSQLRHSDSSPYALVTDLALGKNSDLVVVPIWALRSVSEVARSVEAKSTWAFDLSQLLDPQILYLVQLLGKQFNVTTLLKYAKGLINPDARLEGKTIKECQGVYKFEGGKGIIYYNYTDRRLHVYEPNPVHEWKHIKKALDIPPGSRWLLNPENTSEAITLYSGYYFVQDDALDLIEAYLWSPAAKSQKLRLVDVIFDQDSCTYKIPEAISRTIPGRDDPDSLKVREAVSHFIDILAKYIDNPWALYGIKGPGVWTGSELDEFRLTFELDVLGLRVMDTTPIASDGTKDFAGQSAEAIAAENALEKAKATPYHLHIASSGGQERASRKDYSDLVKRVVYNTIIMPMYQLMKQNLWGASYKIEFVAWGRPIYSAIGFGQFSLSQDFETSVGGTPTHFKFDLVLRDATYGVIREYPKALKSVRDATKDGADMAKAVMLRGYEESISSTSTTTTLPFKHKAY